MKLKSLSIMILCCVVVFGGIYAADVMGYWETTSSKVPATYRDGAFDGKYNPADIRGSYSFGDIEKSFGVPPEVMARAFNIKSDRPDEVKAKDLESLYHFEDGREIGTASVRYFVALFNELPYEGVEWLPETALDVLMEFDKISNETVEVILPYIISIAEITGSSTEDMIGTDTGIVNSVEDHDSAVAVRGKTTFSDLIEYGITESVYEEILGVEVENKNLLVKDVCSQNGLSFGEIKEQLNILLEE